MAAKKKKKRKGFKAKKGAGSVPELYSEFMAALLSGDVKAVALIERFNGGRLELDYDDAVEEEDA